MAELCDLIFSRVDWTWLSEDTALLPHGWTPEIGFLPYRWDYYSELMMMYLLGLGSSAHPLREILERVEAHDFEYEGLRYIGSFAPLFVHQYSQAWFDFRGKRDKYRRLFREFHYGDRSASAFLHRAWESSFPITATTLGHHRFGFGKRLCDLGGPPAMGPIDGTVVPSAPGGSLPFPPQATLRTLKTYAEPVRRAWSKYGFVNAFNPSEELV